jgi:hypothetical protein
LPLDGSLVFGARLTADNNYTIQLAWVRSFAKESFVRRIQPVAAAKWSAGLQRKQAVISVRFWARQHHDF